MKTIVFVNLITPSSNLRIAEIDNVELKYGQAFFTEEQWAEVKRAEAANTRNLKGYSIEFHIPGCTPLKGVHYPSMQRRGQVR